MTYSTDMDAAPRDGTRFVALVPTGDADAPISEEMVYWDDGLQRFEGEWRHVEMPVGDPNEKFAEADPIAWLALPDIPDELHDLAMRKAA